ncbi:MAG TPA: hypothetical protein VF846_13645 [Thermoanaerobaculia bacterium]|jgi:hypothetical protein
MGKLKITCRGVLTHFIEGFCGVPHRIVLPDATAIRFGQIDIPQPGGGGATANYYTVPHFPFITPNPLPDATGDTDAFLLSGMRVTVANATERQWLTYDRSFKDLICSLRDFVPHYVPSAEVVLGRRAACHFDVTRGRIRAELHETSGEVPVEVPVVVIEIETDGKPALRFEPFSEGVMPYDLILATDEASMVLANLEIDAPADAPQFDYLLHYLTDSAGIPRILSRPTPGMSDQPQSQSDEQIAAALTKLARFIGGQPPTSAEVHHVGTAMGTTVACADSRFP